MPVWPAMGGIAPVFDLACSRKIFTAFRNMPWLFERRRMAGIEHIKVEPDEAGMRLDRWFKVHFPGLGFGQLQKLMRSGQVRVDGGRVKTDARVQPGQMVRVPPLDVDSKTKTGPIAGKELKHS